MNSSNITSRWTAKDGNIYLKYADGSVHKESSVKNIPLILNQSNNLDLCNDISYETTDVKKNSTDILKGVIVGGIVGLILLGVMK
ncbi:MAG: hypothetical protein KAI81_04355 [Candidatus Marinimicrobia bacterium]|nr:hypothetical protein [Candidatus Neomarinimicrobiota bacterium]